MPSRVLRVCAVSYLLVQACGIVGWWVWLGASAAARARFAPEGSPRALTAFAPGDLVILAGLATVAAVGITRARAWTGAVLWFHAGACTYATCWAVALAVGEPGRAVGALMMAPVLLASLAAAWLWSTGRLSPHAPRGGA